MPTIAEMFSPGRGPVVKLVPFGADLGRTPAKWGRFAVIVDTRKVGEITRRRDGTWIAYSPEADVTPGLLEGITNRSAARDYVAARSTAIRRWATDRAHCVLYLRTAPPSTLYFVSARAANRCLGMLTDRRSAGAIRFASADIAWSRRPHRAAARDREAAS